MITAINDQITDEKLQYDIKIEAGIISALSSRKIDKYEYLTSEEILLSNQRQTIEQAKYTYFYQETFLKNKQRRLKSKEKNKQRPWKIESNKTIFLTQIKNHLLICF